jgi:hypothetical protein
MLPTTSLALNQRLITWIRVNSRYGNYIRSQNKFKKKPTYYYQSNQVTVSKNHGNLSVYNVTDDYIALCASYIQQTVFLHDQLFNSTTRASLYVPV